MSEKKYESAAERQKAYRERNRNAPTVTPEATITRPTVTLDCPQGYDPKLWAYACERAARAARYAFRMPEHVRPSETRFQSPEWQYQDQSRYPLPC